MACSPGAAGVIRIRERNSTGGFQAVALMYPGIATQASENARDVKCER